MSNEAGLAKFFLGLAAFTLGTTVLASTITGVSCYYVGKKQRDEESKPKTVYLARISVDEKEQQLIVIENYRAEKFGFLRQPDGAYKSLEQQLKESEDKQRRIFDDIKNKIE